MLECLIPPEMIPGALALLVPPSGIRVAAYLIAVRQEPRQHCGYLGYLRIHDTNFMRYAAYVDNSRCGTCAWI
jgi:hypothetical protein